MAIKIKSKLILSTLALFIGASILSLFPSLPAQAADSAIWINQRTILYKTNYFVDADPTDTNYTYTNGQCGSSIYFKIAGGANDPNQPGLFYFKTGGITYANKEVHYNGPDTLAPIGTPGPIASCGPKKDSKISIINDNARRVTFTRDGSTIKHIHNGATFTLKPGTAGVFINNADGETCKDAIVLTEAIPYDSGWDNPVSGSSVLYSVHDAEHRDKSESYRDVTGVTRTCYLDHNDILSNNVWGFGRGAPGAFPFIEDGQTQYDLAGGVDASGRSLADQSGYSDDAYIIFVGDANNLPNAKGTPPNGISDQAVAPTCRGGALGWIICPIISLIQNATDLVYNKIITPLLTVNPLQANASNPTYVIWEAMRNIANIAFVIAFTVIIFSQATSIGISKYGIKKLLPRIILVAILTNISFFICQFAIDAFNLIGVGTGTLLTQVIPPQFQGVETTDGASAVFGISTIGIGAAILASGGTLTAAIFGFIAIAFFAILAAVLVLILRQIVIILLVMLAPLAFVAWLLPNTEQYFRKWLNAFIELLVMYPIIVGIFACSKIIAAVMSNNAALQGGAQGALVGGVSFFAQTIPLFAIPLVPMLAGASMKKVTGMIAAQRDKFAKGAGEGLYGKTPFGRAAELRKQAVENARQQRFIKKAAEGKGAAGALVNRPGFTPTGRQAQQNALEQIQAAKQKIEDERTNTIKQAVTREAGLHYAPLISQMRRGESGESFIDRYNRENQLPPGQELKAQDAQALNQLRTRFGNQIGSAEFMKGALLASHDMGSNVDQIRTATATYANKLDSDGVSRVDRSNILGGMIAQSAKAGGITNMAGAGLDEKGVYSQFGIKQPDKIVDQTDFRTYDSGQFGDIGKVSANGQVDLNALRNADPSKYALAQAVSGRLAVGGATRNAMLKRIAESKGSKAYNDLAAIAHAHGLGSQLEQMIAGYK